MLRPRPRPNLRERLDELFQPYRGDPSQPRVVLYVDIAIVVCILASCAVVGIEHFTDPEAHPGLHHVMLIAETVFTLLFTVEYGLRWYAAQKRLQFPFSIHALIDLLAILPSLLMLAHVFGGGGAEFLMLRAVRVLRILRLLRLLRLLKIFRHGYAVYRLAVSIRIWGSALVFQYHLHRLARLLLLASVAWVAGANALYLSETVSADPTGHYVSSYWNSYWGVLVFLISGMDAPEPDSLGARVIVTLLLIVGIILVAVFTGEVVSILVRTAERRGRMALKPPGLKLAEHIVILGRNQHLEKLVHQIFAAFGKRHYILVVSDDAESIPSTGPETHRRVFALAGDPSRDDVLDAANIEDARRVIVLADDRQNGTARERDNVSLMHALATISRHRTIPLVVELEEPESLRYAASLHTADCLVSQHFGEKLMSQAVLNAGVTEIYDELMTFSPQTNEFYRVSVPKDLLGKTFREAQEYFLDHDEEAILPVGVELDGLARAYSDFRLCVGDETGTAHLPDHLLSTDDRLIVCAFERPSFDTRKPEDAWQGDELPRR